MRVFQIYFREDQLKMIEPEYLPLYNYDVTPYFENAVIRDLVENGHHKGADYFGVVSYKLRQKLGYMKDSWKNTPNIANHSTNEFTPALFSAELYKGMPDAMSFQRHSPHDPVRTACSYHPRFLEFWQEIMGQIGYDWKPTVIQDIFYCSYFVAKSEIYERYVKEMLAPAMKVMNQMPELFENSNYHGSPFPEHCQKKFGIKHWPYHPFLCERFFSYFAHIHNLKCLHY